VQLPTGDRSSFASDRGAIADLRAMASIDYILLRFTGVVGYRMRFVHHRVSDVLIGDSIPWGATLSFKPLPLGLDPKKWLFSLEAHGAIGASPTEDTAYNKMFASSRVSPAFLGLSVRKEIAKDLFLFGGAELGLTDAIGAPLFRSMLSISYAPTIIDDDHDGVPDDGTDECPGLPEDGQGKKPHDGCPDYEGEETPPTPPNDPITEPLPTPPVPPPVAAADSDNDGIPDDVDKCPDQAETVNGYEDDDGCPESDKDNDTFLDGVDSCPDKAETFNGVTDEDGCPEENAKAPALISEAGGGLAFARAIKFDGPGPSKDSTSDLRALASWLLNHPGVRVKVAVRPDNKTDDAGKVSTTRAISIVEALVRYAHTGGVAEAVPWDPKSKAKTNVELTVTTPAKKP
jgi:OmpA-OmpF porin, OOP family